MLGHLLVGMVVVLEDSYRDGPLIGVIQTLSDTVTPKLHFVCITSHNIQ